VTAQPLPPIHAGYAKLAQSRLGFGGAPLGNLYAPLADAAAAETIAAAVACGMTYFDTAPHYGNGLSERRIGAALRDVPRDAWAISTKVGRILVPNAAAPRSQNGYVDVLPFTQRWDYSHDGTLRSLDDSCRRLGVTCVDFVYIHDLDAATHGTDQPRRFREAMDGAVPALARMKADGAIAGYGLGVNDVEVCLDALTHADLDVILLAGRYTIADQTALTALLPACLARGTRIVLGGPFNSGILATGAQPAGGAVPYFNYAPAAPDVVARVAAIEAVCAAHGVPLKAAALQFPLAHPAVTCVVAGVRSGVEIDDNAAMMARPIPSAFWRDLHAGGLLPADAPVPAAA